MKTFLHSIKSVKFILFIALLITGFQVWASSNKGPSYNPVKEVIINEQTGEKWILFSSGLLIKDNNQGQKEISQEWLNIQPLNILRTKHFMIPLPEGKVMVTGGYSVESNAAVHPTESEVYDPRTGKWEAGASLNSGRSEYCGLLLENGKAALVGGSNMDKGRLTSIEIFDPQTNSFSLTSEMSVERIGHDAIELDDGRILVAGGTDGFLNFFNSSEIYSTETDTWEMVSTPFDFPRSIGKLAKLDDGRILYIGGSNNFISRNNVDIFDPVTNQWSSAQPMNKPRQQFSVQALSDGRIMVVGGLESEFHENYSCTEIYDPAENTWTPGPSMKETRADGSLVALPDGNLIIAGGQNRKSVERYNAITETWEPLPDMNEYRYWFGLSLLPNGELLAVGGSYGWSTIWASAEVLRMYNGDVMPDSDVLNFGEFLLGESPKEELTLSNQGEAWAEITEFFCSNSDFNVSFETPQFLLPHENLIVEVELPDDLNSGPLEETLVFTIDQGNGPESIEVSITGTVLDPTNIQELPSDDIIVFPNPADHQTTIVSNDKILDVTLFDLQGKVIFYDDFILKNRYTLETGSIEEGVYFIKAQTENGQLLKKIIIFRKK